MLGFVLVNVLFVGGENSIRAWHWGRMCDKVVIIDDATEPEPHLEKLQKEAQMNVYGLCYESESKKN